MKFTASRSIYSANTFLLPLLLFCGNALAQISSPPFSTAAPDTVQTASTDTTPDILNSSSSLGDTAQPAEYPDAPQPAQTTASSADPAHQGEQTSRILGIFPNFRAVSANVHLPAQTVKDKFVTASHDSFDYSSIFLPAAVAGINQATNSTPEFHQGAAGYGRYFWHTFVDQTIENYMVEFIVPTITHEDTRYYTLGSGGFLKRAGYSLSRVVITRNDAGHETLNLSEIVGSGAGAGISNLYYPQSERTFSNTASRWGTSIGIDAGTFLIHEFWPDINRAIFHSKQPNY
jgi:hypothetical protein